MSAPHQPLHWRAGDTSLLLDVGGDLLPRVVHWGRDLGPLDDADAAAVVAAGVPAVTNSGYDEPIPVELVPQAPRGYAGRGGLAGSRPGLLTRKSLAHDADGVRVNAADEAAGLALTTTVEVAAPGLLRLRHELTNTGEDDYEVASLPVQLPVPAGSTELLDLTGRWGRERIPQRHRLGYGAWVREGRRGRTGHDSPLLLVAGAPGFGFRHGEVWALHVAWSGDTTVWAERLPEGRSALGGGELLSPGEVRLAPGASYSSPWVYAAHSPSGLDGLSAVLHDHVRARPSHPAAERRVVLNTWEAVYFDHDLDRLTALADHAAEVGVERFVLDDGWFRGRRSERAGLGDWTVDEDVWPDGLHPLVDHVRALGMDFGLWVEPEMVNPDSDLARSHPEWLRGPAPSWRHQHVLDLRHPGCRAHLLERLDALLTEYPIAFLKWDHNRDLVAPVHEQTLAYYALLDDLRARHPGVEIESCASGGGRVDLEVLARTDRIWASDCTDALERQEIQRWTGLLVPPELVGAHVSAPRNHQTGRVHDLSFRAATALFGHLGIEWDISSASAEERAELARWVALHKRLRPLLHAGRVVRVDEPDDTRLVHGVVDHDRARAVFSVVQLRSHLTSVPPPIRLPGLDPRRRYRVRPLPPGDAPRTLQIAPPAWLADGVTLSGSMLAEVGVAAPVLAPGQALLLEVSAAAG